MAYCLVHRSSMKAGGRNIPLDCSIFFNFVAFIIVIQVTYDRVYRN